MFLRYRQDVWRSVFVALIIGSTALANLEAQPAQPDHESIQGHTDEMSQDWGWPKIHVSTDFVAWVDQTNLETWAENIVQAVYFIKDDGDLSVEKLVTNTEMIVKFRKDQSVIAPGDMVIRNKWSIVAAPGMVDGPVVFETLGTADRLGVQKFIPVFHFAVRPQARLTTFVPGSWVWSPPPLLFVDTVGGKRCVQAQWTGRLLTSGCRITGPPMKINETECGSYCWMYDALCAQGVAEFTQPAPTCPAGVVDCNQLKVEVGWDANWFFDEVSLDASYVVPVGPGVLKMSAKIVVADTSTSGKRSDDKVVCADQGDMFPDPSFTGGAGTSTAVGGTSPPVQTCPDARKKELHDRVNHHCKRMSRRCTFKSSCQELGVFRQRNQNCLDARINITNECFGGIEDDGHKTAREETERALANCVEIFQAKGC